MLIHSYVSALFLAVEKVKAQWDSTQHGVEIRQQQLRCMLSDSTKWDDQKQEMEKLIGKYELYLHALLQSPKEMLIKQISENKSFHVCAGKKMWYSTHDILSKS
ncbi:UNVERIFIED_CONTAM: hypothetical protein K2H54_064536 [Gekko kuhli]